jgi:hypothetical protein
MSTPTTRNSFRKGSSLVPKFPETPVTRTLRFVAMASEARFLNQTQVERGLPGEQVMQAAA